MNNEKGVVDYEVRDQIAFIYLNRPHRLNAVIPQLVIELLEALDRAIEENVKVLILSGKGRAFCSGHDLKQNENRSNDEAKRRTEIERIQQVTKKIRQAPFPVIAAVHGYALGAGCEFALCCDLVIASEETKFGFPEVAVGLSVTGGISHILPMTVGLVKAKELLFLSEKFTANEAKQLNLINYVVSDIQLEEKAIEIAKKLMKVPQQSLMKAKAVLNYSSQSNIENAFQMELEHVLLTSVNKTIMKNI